MLIPVNVEPFCMIAGYLGLFGFFLAGLPGIFALACGLVGLGKLRDKPGQKGNVRAWTGIVLGVLQCILLAWFAYLALTA